MDLELLTAEQGERLVGLARSSLEETLGVEPTAELEMPSWLEEAGATFVTLQIAADLRGCVGTLEAHRSLFEDVRANAMAAGFRDPRFEPLRREELSLLRVEVSVLGVPVTIEFSSEDALMDSLRPGQDGVIIEASGRRATFLPKVWDTLPKPRQFLRELKRKAGLKTGDSTVELQAWRYGVSSWADRDA